MKVGNRRWWTTTTGRTDKSTAVMVMLVVCPALNFFFLGYFFWDVSVMDTWVRV